MKIKKNSLSKELSALIQWSLLRHKSLLPVFTVIQIFLSIAIVYGLALLIPDIDVTTAIYLSSGSVVIGIIAVGCVLCAQIISTAKQNGIVDYQRTLPIKRMNILIADLLIWGLASFPGIFIAFVAAHLRFDIPISFSFTAFLVLLFIQACMISIGFSLAYCLSPNAVGLATQVIMIGALLFSPLTYPSARLPTFIVTLLAFLPFVPSAKIIRTLFFKFETFTICDVFVILCWLIITLGLSLRTLSRKD